MPKTAKQVYKDLLVELHKVNAPALMLAEFNYYVNKAVSQYVNQIYNIYDVNQQTTDDLRVLQGSVRLTPKKAASGDGYECLLPMDYMHMLNCVCKFESQSSSGSCYGEGECFYRPATRLVADAWPLVIRDFYNRPSYKRPYYRIYNNVVDGNSLPLDPVTEIEDAEPGSPTTTGTDINGVYGVDTYDSDILADGETPGGNQKRTFTFKNGHKESLVERSAAQRIGNPSSIRLEIMFGSDSSGVSLKEVQVDYIRVPQYIKLTQEQLDLTQDVSQMLEFPDYICQEITDILVGLVMERSGDPRLANNLQINKTVARPSQQASQQQAAASA